MSKLTFYFKSGNKVTIDEVTSWEINSNGGEIVSITIGQLKEGLFRCKNRMIVESIDLKAIDCIIETDF